MADAAQDLRNLTIEDFDRLMENDHTERDFELIDGELFMMTNPTEAHEQIASNIGARLKLAMDRKGCRTYQGGMRVQASDDSTGHDKYKPDVVVRCGSRDNRRTYITDPVIVIEVLSPSTMDHDRGVKLRFYKSQPSLQHIVLAYSDQMRIEHYRRGPEVWEFTALIRPEDILSLDAVGFQISLEDIYFDLAL